MPQQSRRCRCGILAAGHRSAPRGDYGRRRPLASDNMATTWTAPALERTEPSRIGTEREALEQWLDFHRDTLLMKCSGLTADQLKARAVPPSPLSLLGLVRHMTEVERWWFRMHAANEQIDFRYCTDGDDDADFTDLEGADASGNLEAFRLEIEAARAAVRDKQLEDVVASRGHDPRPDAQYPLDLPAHDRGVRAAQRSRRLDPRVHRRRRR